MKTGFRIIAALALLGALSACAQLGIPAPSLELHTPEMPESVPG